MRLVAADALARRRRHADHVRRRAVEPRARDGGGRGEAGLALRPRRQRRRARAADGQRAARPAARRRGALRRRPARRARPRWRPPPPTSVRARAAARSSFRSAHRRRSAPAAFVARRRRAARRRSTRPTSSSTRPRPAARKPGSSPAARWRARGRASSASAPTNRPRRSRPTFGGFCRASRICCSDRAHARALAGAEVEVDDRVRRRWLRRADAAVARGDRARRAQRGAVSRSDLHGQGDGRPASPALAPARSSDAETVLFWHTGGQVGLFA